MPPALPKRCLANLKARLGFLTDERLGSVASRETAEKLGGGFLKGRWRAGGWA